MLGSISDIAEVAPLSFVVGVVVGLFLASYFRIVKRNSNGEKS